MKLDLLFSDVEIWALSGGLVDVSCVGERPWKWVLEGSNQVDEGPSDDHVVVGSDAVSRHDRGKTNTHKSWVNSTEHSNISTLELLSEGQLHKSNWQSNGHKAEEVWHEEESTTPFETEVRETPEVSKSDTVTNHSKDEGGSAEPSSTLSVFFLVLKDFV